MTDIFIQTVAIEVGVVTIRTPFKGFLGRFFTYGRYVPSTMVSVRFTSSYDFKPNDEFVVCGRKFTVITLSKSGSYFAHNKHSSDTSFKITSGVRHFIR